MNGYELLGEIAQTAMKEKGLSTDFPLAALQQLNSITAPAKYQKEIMRDLRNLLWCSIDNDDSKDLDQLTVAYQEPDGNYRLYIAIADVDALVHKNTSIDLHAQINTTSVYTPAKIFPMLPEKLSTDLTSLNENVERISVIFEIYLDTNVEVISTDIYSAVVKNYAKLAYSSVGDWLEKRKPIPDKISLVAGLKEALILQDQIAQSIKKKREAHGALTFETREMIPIFKNNKVVDLLPVQKNQAHELIENLMIAANTASAKFVIQHNIPSLRRVVRVPARWDRIVSFANSLGANLPLDPDPIALEDFLNRQKEKDPNIYPEVSLSIIKLLGSGEYVVEIPGDPPIGHFGLALRDYTHSTAPNRRYPDLITQRLLKAVLRHEPPPYSIVELENLASLCTHCEDVTTKVERQVKKSAAAMVLVNRIGETFEAMVTGASDTGTWVRLCKPPIEGKLVKGGSGLDVGDRLNVKLINVNIRAGFIDFIGV